MAEIFLWSYTIFWLLFGLAVIGLAFWVLINIFAILIRLVILGAIPIIIIVGVSMLL